MATEVKHEFRVNKKNNFKYQLVTRIQRRI